MSSTANILRNVRKLESLGLLDASTLQAIGEIKELAADVGLTFARMYASGSRERFSFWQGCMWNSQS